MTEHVCEWGVLRMGMALCIVGDERCQEVLHCDEIERRLNEYETLKSEFAHFRAYIRGMLPQASNPAASNQWILDAISRVIREHETLKKATDVLSAKDVWKIITNKCCEGYIQDALRAYADTLEGKDDQAT